MSVFLLCYSNVQLCKRFFFLRLLPPCAPSVGQCSAGRGWGSPLVRMFTQKRVCGIQVQGLRHQGPPESLQTKAQLLPPHPMCIPKPPRLLKLISTDTHNAPIDLSLPLCTHILYMHHRNNENIDFMHQSMSCTHWCLSVRNCTEYIRNGVYVWADTKAWCADIRPKEWKCIKVWRNPDPAWCHPERPEGWASVCVWVCVHVDERKSDWAEPMWLSETVLKVVEAEAHCVVFSQRGKPRGNPFPPGTPTPASV